MHAVGVYIVCACLPACCGRFSGGWFVFVLVCSFWMSAHCVEFYAEFYYNSLSVSARAIHERNRTRDTHSLTHYFSLIKLRSLQFTIRVEHMTYFLINIHAPSHSDIQTVSQWKILRHFLWKLKSTVEFLCNFWSSIQRWNQVYKMLIAKTSCQISLDDKRSEREREWEKADIFLQFYLIRNTLTRAHTNTHSHTKFYS